MNSFKAIYKVKGFPSKETQSLKDEIYFSQVYRCWGVLLHMWTKVTHHVHVIYSACIALIFSSSL